MSNGLAGSEEAVGMFSAAGEGEVVDFEEVGAGSGGLECEFGVAVEWRAIVGAGEFFAIGGDKGEDGVEARIDCLSLTVEVDGLIFGESEAVVVDCGIVDVAIHDGVEREGFSRFGRVIGAVLFFKKVADDEGSGSGETEAGLSGDFVNSGGEVGRGGDTVAQGVRFGWVVGAFGNDDGFRNEAGVREAKGGCFLEFSSADGDFDGGARLDPLRKDGLQVGVRELRVKSARTRNRERQSFEEAEW